MKTIKLKSAFSRCTLKTYTIAAHRALIDSLSEYGINGVNQQNSIFEQPYELKFECDYFVKTSNFNLKTTAFLKYFNGGEDSLIFIQKIDLIVMMNNKLFLSKNLLGTTFVVEKSVLKSMDISLGELFSNTSEDYFFNKIVEFKSRLIDALEP